MESKQSATGKTLLPFVITIHEQDTVVKIYGPFESEVEAIGFGDEWQEKNDDSPFWNVIWHDGAPIVAQKPVIAGSAKFTDREVNTRTTEQFEFDFNTKS
jgi:hypothetical protein